MTEAAVSAGRLVIGETVIDGKPFELPLDAVASREAIIAISGVGKTILGTVKAEEMCERQQPWIALDVVGNWWGLRVGKDLKTPGYRVVVIGGRQADLPAHAGLGARYAEALVNSNVFAVVDLSTMKKVDRWRFTTDFVDALLRNPPASPRHVFFEEVKELASQTPEDRDANRCRSAIDSFCTVGRNYGYGYTAIGQRPAKISKDVLTQCGSLFLMRLQATQDLDAVMDWVLTNGPEVSEAAFRKQLARLPKGEAFWVNPESPVPLVHVRIRPRKTLHPAELMKLNPGALKTVELADAGSFVEALKRELSKTIVAVPSPTEPAAKKPKGEPQKPREASAEAPPTAATSSALEEVRLERDRLAGRVVELEAELKRERVALQVLGISVHRLKEQFRPQYEAMRVLFDPNEVAVGTPGAQPIFNRAPWEQWLKRAGEMGARRLLESVLDRGRVKRVQLATLAGLSPSGSQMRKYMAWMRRNHLVEETEGGDVVRKELA